MFNESIKNSNMTSPVNGLSNTIKTAEGEYQKMSTIEKQ